jgi:uncharacterized cupin superfamily protein
MTATAGHHGPASQIAVFTATDAIRSPAAGPAADVMVTMTSADRKFETGFYQVGAEHEEYVGAGYDNDEFCYILTGSVVLTAANGRVETLGPGDSVSIPRGWVGRWDSDGYTKLWVIYYGNR